MEELYELLLIDMKLILTCYMILLMACSANVVLKMYNNIALLGETFERKRLFKGIKKACVLIIGTLLMVVSVDTATMLLTQYVPSVNEQVHDLINVAMICATIGVATWRYIKDAYNTFINILNGNPTEVSGALENEE